MIELKGKILDLIKISIQNYGKASSLYHPEVKFLRMKYKKM